MGALIAGVALATFPYNLDVIAKTTTIRDFYLNNILIHELGHLLDDRNRSYGDRERYAEWFALKYGYQATGGNRRRKKRQKVVRRRHAN